MRFLLCGFAPFGGSSINPSYEAVKRIPDKVGENEIFRAEIPVSYARCGAVLEEEIAAVQPDCVLCLGQAAGREGLSLETTAVNVRASADADTDGVTYSGECIVPSAPESLRARLPLKELCALLNDEGIQAKLSYSAGTYVCNNLFYHMLRYADAHDPRLLCGFIHIPACEEQKDEFPGGTPLMSTAEVVRALLLTIRQISDN